jgi:hypothetical protein
MKNAKRRGSAAALVVVLSLSSSLPIYAQRGDERDPRDVRDVIVRIIKVIRGAFGVSTNDDALGPPRP